MARYLVTWETFVDANDPEEAVQKARAQQLRSVAPSQENWTAADCETDKVFAVDLFMDTVKQIGGEPTPTCGAAFPVRSPVDPFRTETGICTRPQHDGGGHIEHKGVMAG